MDYEIKIGSNGSATVLAQGERVATVAGPAKTWVRRAEVREGRAFFNLYRAGSKQCVGSVAKVHYPAALDALKAEL